MTDLTPYQQEKFAHLGKIQEGKKYKIDPNRPDREEFIACLKLYADTWGLLEFNEDYTAFKRIYPPGTAWWLVENQTFEKIIR